MANENLEELCQEFKNLSEEYLSIPAFDYEQFQSRGLEIYSKLKEVKDEIDNNTKSFEIQKKLYNQLVDFYFEKYADKGHVKTNFGGDEYGPKELPEDSFASTSYSQYFQCEDCSKYAIMTSRLGLLIYQRKPIGNITTNGKFSFFRGGEYCNYNKKVKEHLSQLSDIREIENSLNYGSLFNSIYMLTGIQSEYIGKGGGGNGSIEEGLLIQRIK